MNKEIKTLIEQEINPVLNQHNGACEFVDFSDGKLLVKLVGGCTGCPGRKMTFMNGIVPFIKSNLEYVKEVELVD